MIFRSKAPLRISFAGGGTDIEPYKDDYGGCVLSTTINKYCYATLIPSNDGDIFITSYDFDITEKYNGSLDGELKLIKGIIKRFNPKQGFHLYVKSDAPIGSGLGASSSLVVAVIGVLDKWLESHLTQYEIANLAYDIERKDLGIKGGYQDQYASVFGGFNYIEFLKDRVIVNPLLIKEDYLYELENNLLLIHTGEMRKESNVIDDNYLKKVNKLHEIKNLTYLLKQSLYIGDLDKVGYLLNQGWLNKRDLSGSISNSAIDDLYELGLKSGTIGGKLLGRGGGGHLLFYCKENKYKVSEALNKIPIEFQFDQKGLVVWSNIY